ncbi:MAG: hypothetical protein BEN19_03240 [Epulopiscium sp. Nuni2H_MBin003]|nr:MAG: hypothetical protein BEN19_03240 [Epulopiscium sp. Nuni2H_MBin003]
MKWSILFFILTMASFGTYALLEDEIDIVLVDAHRESENSEAEFITDTISVETLGNIEFYSKMTELADVLWDIMYNKHNIDMTIWTDAVYGNVYSYFGYYNPGDTDEIELILQTIEEYLKIHNLELTVTQDLDGNEFFKYTDDEYHVEFYTGEIESLPHNTTFFDSYSIINRHYNYTNYVGLIVRPIELDFSDYTRQVDIEPALKQQMQQIYQRVSTDGLFVENFMFGGTRQAVRYRQALSSIRLNMTLEMEDNQICKVGIAGSCTAPELTITQIDMIQKMMNELGMQDCSTVITKINEILQNNNVSNYEISEEGFKYKLWVTGDYNSYDDRYFRLNIEKPK